MSNKNTTAAVIISITLSVVVFLGLSGLYKFIPEIFKARTIEIVRNDVLAPATTIVTGDSNQVDLIDAPPVMQQPKRTAAFLANISAYSSEPGQTDSTPFITAFGTHVRPGIIANNCLPKGTPIEIQGEFFVVEDRMNARYGCEYFDIWFADTGDAWEFGRQELPVLVYNFELKI